MKPEYKMHPKMVRKLADYRKRKSKWLLAATACSAWGVLWRSECRLDGVSSHLIHRNLLPAIFKTRKQAVDFIEKEYGYIRQRPDLKSEPHGWRMPKPVRVTITPNVQSSGARG